MARPGRPAIAPDDRKDCTVTIRLTPAEHAALSAIATERGTTLSDLTREYYVTLLTRAPRRATWGRTASNL